MTPWKHDAELTGTDELRDRIAHVGQSVVISRVRQLSRTTGSPEAEWDAAEIALLRARRDQLERRLAKAMHDTGTLRFMESPE